MPLNTSAIMALQQENAKCVHLETNIAFAWIPTFKLVTVSEIILVLFACEAFTHSKDKKSEMYYDHTSWGR